MPDGMQLLDYEGLATFKEFLNAADIVTATSQDGAAYTATIPNMTELKAGKIITIIPNRTSAATIPTLNMNNLGAKNIKQRLAVNTSLTAEAATETWMIANKPLPLLFDGTQWVTITGRPAATTLYGTTSIENGGTGGATVEEARVNLGIGSNLYVTAPVGVTVTVTKGETTYTQTPNAEGIAIFEGLTIGEWTITMTNGDEAASETVTVTPDYSVTLAFFSSTISVIYPAGSTCTCTNGATTLTAPNTSGSYAFTLPNQGTWTVSCTNGTDTDSKTVSITATGQVETVTLNYESIPEFDYTGDFEVVNDDDEAITTSRDNWKIRLLTSGTLTFTKLNGAENGIDVFCVGGGGGSANAYRSYPAGGGGGYTNTLKNKQIDVDVEYEIEIGAGGTPENDGSATSAFGVTAAGGDGTDSRNVGGSGGSGGGSGETAADGGNDGGSNGSDGVGEKAGMGQISTPGPNGETGNTSEFGEEGSRLYSGGGAGTAGSAGAGGGGELNCPGEENTGGGAGGYYLQSGSANSGGSGIVIIRNKR